jgi:hypothetical protein
MSIYSDIIKNGKFYFPASAHYNKPAGEVNVVCDRCQKNGLISCVGYMEYDLCMPCVETITQSKPPTQEPKPKRADRKLKMAQSMFRPDIRPDMMTNMQQSMFRPDIRPANEDDDYALMPSASASVSASASASKGGGRRRPELMTFMMQSQFRTPDEDFHTYMQQDQFGPGRPLTRMFQLPFSRK